MFRLRDAETEDLLGIAKVKIDTWSSAYRGIIPDDVLDSFSINEQAEKFGEMFLQGSEKSFLIVAEVEGAIVGFAAGGCEREGKYGIDGEVFAVYVLKEYQKEGIGKALMAHSAKLLESMGFKSMLVWVLDKNPYKRFYEKHGGIQIDKKRFEIGGREHTIVAYAWTDGLLGGAFL